LSSNIELVISGLKDLMRCDFVIAMGDIQALAVAGSFSAAHDIGGLKYYFCIKKEWAIWFECNM
jgi:hypothetical protein